MSTTPLFVPGQRCVSVAEPELGLGKIVSIDRRFVEVAFPGNDRLRKYAAASAPLTRIVFKIGDSIKDENGNDFRITEVRGNAGQTLTYLCGPQILSEDAVAGTCTASTPLRRLLNGISDRCDDFAVRFAILQAQSEIKGSPIRGFAGGRIDLLPHQLFIAQEVTSRRIVRVLLADETGLGKTIEACLILHRLIQTGRVRRCLICVPETLMHQWFVELLRRFNLMFRLFNKEHFDSQKEGQNPFSSDFGICPIQALAAQERLCDLAVSAGWDMVIVDEAHHLHHETRQYACIRRLSESSAGLILLTATPEQLGRYDHFLRLQLLDPDRYSDFASYTAETDRFRELSHYINERLREKGVDPAEASPDRVLIDIPANLALQGQSPASDPSRPARQITLRELVDRFGTGRVMFRNTRQVISGFPKRIVHIEPLSNIDCQRSHNGYATGIVAAGNVASLQNDPRTTWLIDLLNANAVEKFLVIGTTKEMALALQETLQRSIRTPIAVFHEGMTLLQRDRNAAWFAEDNGARVLLCSEIGSEGRNFQFCRNCVLFDLPLDPEVLEQRIGRVDRIGQGPVIHIYVPYVAGTSQEALCRWYHEGLDAFRRNSPAAGSVGEAVRETLDGLLNEAVFPAEKLKALIDRSAALRQELSQRLSSGRDRLLEMSSFRPREARALIDAITLADREKLAAKAMEPLFKHYGICSEEAGHDKRVLITDYVTDQRFPLPRHERPLMTYARETALSREDIEFISIDHPMVLGGMELFLSTDCGTSVFALWKDARAKDLLLEALYVLECIAPEALCIGRFLPPTVMRIVVDHEAREVTEAYPLEQCNDGLMNASVEALLAKRKITGAILPRMAEASEARARQRARPIIEKSLAAMHDLLIGEIRRARDLQKVNPPVSPWEIEALCKEKEALENHLNNARVRLDSIRVIWRGVL